jgi:hypothetical protein
VFKLILFQCLKKIEQVKMRYIINNQVPQRKLQEFTKKQHTDKLYKETELVNDQTNKRVRPQTMKV